VVRTIFRISEVQGDLESLSDKYVVISNKIDIYVNSRREGIRRYRSMPTAGDLLIRVHTEIGIAAVERRINWQNHRSCDTPKTGDKGKY